MVQIDIDKRIEGVDEGSDVIVDFNEKDDLLFFNKERIAQ